MAQDHIAGRASRKTDTGFSEKIQSAHASAHPALQYGGNDFPLCGSAGPMLGTHQTMENDPAQYRGPPGSMLQKGHPMEDHAFLLSIERIFGNALGVDSGVAGVLAALGITPLQDRCWQEGVTIIWAGYSHIQVFLVYQGKIMGMYEQHTGLPQEVLLNDLSQLRLNWLPDEQVRSCGGHGCVCGDLPAEAEGFRPTWILGPRRADFKAADDLQPFAATIVSTDVSACSSALTAGFLHDFFSFHCFFWLLSSVCC